MVKTDVLPLWYMRSSEEKDILVDMYIGLKRKFEESKLNYDLLRMVEDELTFATPDIQFCLEKLAQCEKTYNKWSASKK